MVIPDKQNTIFGNPTVEGFSICSNNKTLIAIVNMSCKKNHKDPKIVSLQKVK